MKKISVLFGLAALLLAATPVLASQGFTGNVLSDNAQDSTVFERMYTQESPEINSNGLGACKGARFVWHADTRLCEVKFIAGGYRGYSEDTANYGGTDGKVHFIVWDVERNTNAGNHTGYYFCASKVVNPGESHSWTAVDCIGTSTGSTCLGQGNKNNATGKEQASTPLGTIEPLPASGFRPVPVPKPSKANNGVIPVSWSAADCINAGGAISYDLYYVVSNTNEAATVGALKFLKNVTGLSTTVNVAADLGADSFPPTTAEPKYITFALKLRYPDAKNATEVRSLYLSANSQAVVFGGTAATVTNLAAKYVGKTNIEVSWKTSLEDGVQSFVVKRALLPNGPFQVVGTVPAKGQASSYSFIDTVQLPAGRVTTSGLYYKVETIDVDNNATAYGPVKAQLPVSTNRPVIIKEKPARKVTR